MSQFRMQRHAVEGKVIVLNRTSWSRMKRMYRIGYFMVDYHVIVENVISLDRMECHSANGTVYGMSSCRLECLSVALNFFCP